MKRQTKIRKRDGERADKVDKTVTELKASFINTKLKQMNTENNLNNNRKGRGKTN